MDISLLTDEQKDTMRTTFSSPDLAKQAVVAGKKGERTFIGTDDINYSIPEFLIENNVDLQTQNKPIDLTLKPKKVEGKQVEQDPFRTPDGNITIPDDKTLKDLGLDSPEVPEEEKDLIFSEQTKNKELIKSLERTYGKLPPEDLLEQWANDQHRASFNMFQIGQDALFLDNLKPQEKQDYLLQMETWDRTKGTGDGSQPLGSQSWQITKAIATDYITIGATLYSFFTAGGTLVAEQISKEATRAGIKAFLKNEVKKNLNKTMLASGAKQGAAWGAYYSVNKQVIEQKAADKISNYFNGLTNLNVPRTILETATGAALGVVLNAGLTTAGTLLQAKKRFQKELKLQNIELSEAEQEAILNEVSGIATEVMQEVVQPAATEAQPTPTAGIETILDVDFDPLPKELKNARGYYGKTQVIFQNDVQRAVYIAGNVDKPSKRYDEFLVFASEQLGIPQEDVIKLGMWMRKYVGTELTKIPGEKPETFSLKDVNFPKQKKVKRTTTGEPVDPAEIPAEVAKMSDEDKKALFSTWEQIDPNAPRTPSEGAPYNFELGGFADAEAIKFAQASVEAFAESTGPVTNKDTLISARRIIANLRTPEAIKAFLISTIERVDKAPEESLALRILFADQVNSIIQQVKNTPNATGNALDTFMQNELLTDMYIQTTKAANLTKESAGRTLQAQQIIPIATKQNKVAEMLANQKERAAQMRARGRTEDEILAAISDEERATLDTLIEELDKEVQKYRSLGRGVLIEYDNTESLFTKIQRASAQLWANSTLGVYTALTPALSGTIFKKTTMTSEDLITYALGLTFNHKDRLKFAEFKAKNRLDIKGALETWNILSRQWLEDNGNNFRENLQLGMLDSRINRFDDPTSHGALWSQYLRYDNPQKFLGVLPMQKIFTKVVDRYAKVIDNFGMTTDSSFMVLGLLDDVTKRSSYLPYIEYLAMRKASYLFPDDADGATIFVARAVKAFELQYSKKASRDHTMNRIVMEQMEVFNRKNPNATIEEAHIARAEAEAKAEEAVAMSPDDVSLVNEFMEKYPEWHKEAIEYGRKITYTREIPTHLAVTTAIPLLLDQLRQKAPILGTVAPYLKTGVGMSRDFAQSVPGLGLISTEMQAQLKAGGVEATEVASKQILGGTFMLASYYMWENGRIIPSQDNVNYELTRSAGITSASVNVGESDIPLYRFGVPGMLAQLTADTSELYNRLTEYTDTISMLDSTEQNREAIEELEGLKEDIQKSLFLVTFKTFASVSPMGQADDFYKVLADPTSERAEKYFARWGSNFTPMHATLSPIIGSDAMYEVEGLMDNVRKKLGLMSEQYGDHIARNIFGEKLPNIQRISGLHWAVGKPVKDPLINELFKIKPLLKLPSKRITMKDGRFFDLDPKDHQNLIDTIGENSKLIRARVNAAVMDSKGLPNGVQGEPKGLLKTRVSIIEEAYNEAINSVVDIYKSKNQKLLIKKYLGDIKAGMILEKKQRNKTTPTTAEKILQFRGL